MAAASLSAVLPPTLSATIRAWLAEDIPSFDVGGFVVGDAMAEARLLGKSAGVLAGVPFFEAVFKELGCTVVWHASDGERIEPIKHVATVTGPVRAVLQGERLALNIITRASGVATQAAALRAVADKHRWHGEIAASRKTTPGFRLVEKYAVLVGRNSTHRMDLSSMVMLKDNHVWSSGNITAAVHKARSACGFSSKIEVECRNLEEAMEAGAAGADVIMLDNYTPHALKKDAAAIKLAYPAVMIEASGGITLESLPQYLDESVDIISTSSTTQGYKALDFSLKLQKTPVLRSKL